MFQITVNWISTELLSSTQTNGWLSDINSLNMYSETGVGKTGGVCSRFKNNETTHRKSIFAIVRYQTRSIVLLIE